MKKVIVIAGLLGSEPAKLATCVRDLLRDDWQEQCLHVDFDYTIIERAALAALTLSKRLAGRTTAKLVEQAADISKYLEVDLRASFLGRVMEGLKSDQSVIISLEYRRQDQRDDHLLRQLREELRFGLNSGTAVELLVFDLKPHPLGNRVKRLSRPDLRDFSDKDELQAFNDAIAFYEAKPRLEGSIRINMCPDDPDGMPPMAAARLILETFGDPESEIVAQAPSAPTPPRLAPPRTPVRAPPGSRPS